MAQIYVLLVMHFLTVSALPVPSLPLAPAENSSPPSHNLTSRKLPPDVTINILFSILSALLAIITIIQAAYLARAYFRTSRNITANIDLGGFPLPTNVDDTISNVSNGMPDNAPASLPPLTTAHRTT